jgi:hypothetical protein
MARKPADKVGLVLRFSEALRRRIEKAAEGHKQSMNSEIIERLEASFQKEDRQAELEAIADRAAAKAAKRGGEEAATRDWASDPEGARRLFEMLKPFLAALPPQSGGKK